MSDSNDAFLQEIQSDPEDIVPRLVYADWLEENGDPLADLIRVQCQLADLPVDSPDRAELVQQERELLIEHRQKIVEPLQKFSPHALEVNRGFVESIRLDADVLIQNADEIVRLLPGLCSLTIRKSGKHLDDLVKLPQLEHIKSLSLGMAGLQNGGVQKLLSSPHWSGLVELNLRGNGLSLIGLRWLSECEAMAGIRRLELSNNDITSQGLAHIRKSEHFQNLQHLALAECRISQIVEGLRGQGLPNLESLDLTHTGLGDSTTARLIETDRSYRTLILNKNSEFGKAAVTRLASAAPTENLQHLEMARASVKVAGVKSVLAAGGLPAIEYLSACGQRTLKNDGKVGNRKGVSSSPRFLDLSENGINDRALPGILRSGIFARTVDLNLRRNKLTDDSIPFLFESENTPALRRLHLVGNNLSNHLLSDLAKLPQLRQLERITVDRPMLTHRAAFDEFFESPHRNPFVQIAVPAESGISRTENRMNTTNSIVRQLGESIRGLLEVI